MLTYGMYFGGFSESEYPKSTLQVLYSRTSWLIRIPMAASRAAHEPTAPALSSSCWDCASGIRLT